MFFWSKKKSDEKPSDRLNSVYAKLMEAFDESAISDERKTYLTDLVKANGYLPYPYFKALDELTDAETLFALKEKWIQNGVFSDGKFDFEKSSVLARNNVQNADWIKKEGHDIKLINLAGLGNHEKEAGKFFDWLKQLLILPTGNLDNNIYNTTIYLIPFHPREFGCAYLPKSSEVSEALCDKKLEELTGLDAKGQVKLFIELAQLAGHPVIYDILPQTARFSKAVLANPSIARWYDIKTLQAEIESKLDTIELEDCDAEDISVIKDIYKQGNSAGDLSEHYKNMYDEFEEKILVYKKDASEKMLSKGNQIKLQKRVREVIAKVLGTKSKTLTEDDITKQLEIIQELINQGLWSAPGGAWCSAGVPIYDRMSECGSYPVFKHFDYKGEDVTHFANLDCQTPFYFVNLEDGTFNENVINYFVNYMLDLQKEYGFDGFRVDHIDHVADKVSEKDGVPISYRAPRVVLGRLNKAMKSKIPYFATLAEYMLWDNLYKEYHQDMNFDILWGNDIVSQFEKTPEKIIEDNQYLTNYNVGFKQGEYLSILKTYNNQDGEFNCICQYPGQLTENGAIFKWFKYKFLSGGKFAQRPILYVDGDESYTKRGIEHAISEEVSMKRGCDNEFYEKFNAIDKFVKNNPIITNGEAQIITQEDDGFAAWLITKEPLKTAYLVVANYKYPTENVCPSENTWQDGETIFEKEVFIPSDYVVACQYELTDNGFEKVDTTEISIDELKPSEFKFFELAKN